MSGTRLPSTNTQPSINEVSLDSPFWMETMVTDSILSVIVTRYRKDIFSLLFLFRESEHSETRTKARVSSSMAASFIQTAVLYRLSLQCQRNPFRDEPQCTVCFALL